MSDEEPDLGIWNDPILKALADSHHLNFRTLAKQFSLRWSRILGCQTEWEGEIGELGIFKSRFQGLFLRGFETVRCWIIPPWLEISSLFATPQRARQAGIIGGQDIPIVICFRQSHEQIAGSGLPSQRAIVLGPQALGMLFAYRTSEARKFLSTKVRLSINLLAIQPFDTTRPICGEMFFGRKKELDLLLNFSSSNFLITGPSRIGKTSLARQYGLVARSEGLLRAAKSFEINLQPCINRNIDEVARYVAMQFREMPYTIGNLVFGELRSFLNSVVAHFGGPIEIILDEVDAVCNQHGELIMTMAEFSTSTRSRLILIGRGALRQYWRENQATSLGRLRDMRFTPLSGDEAWNLFCLPVEALGLTFTRPEDVRALVLHHTSRMPHLLQALGQATVTRAFETRTTSISTSFILRTYDSFDRFSFLRIHLEDLQNDLVRIAAIEFLTQPQPGNYTTQALQHLMNALAIKLPSRIAADICDELVINCIIGWEDGSYTSPRWDILETAQKHRQYLNSLKQDCLSSIKGYDK